MSYGGEDGKRGDAAATLPLVFFVNGVKVLYSRHRLGSGMLCVIPLIIYTPFFV